MNTISFDSTIEAHFLSDKILKDQDIFDILTFDESKFPTNEDFERDDDVTSVKIATLRESYLKIQELSILLEKRKDPRWLPVERFLFRLEGRRIPRSRKDLINKIIKTNKRKIFK